MTLLLGGTPAAAGGALAAPWHGSAEPVTVDDHTTRPTLNEFYPEQRPLSECLSSLPKPDCGSEARGGWAQTTVFVALLVGLAFIAWRIVAGARRARGSPITSGARGRTTVPDDDGGPRP